jgi:hypothetical protein
MLKGCFRNIFALIGCFTVLVVLGVLGWGYRAQIVGLVRSVTEKEPAASGGDSLTVGTASPEALRSAERKEAAIAQPGGPAFVTLTAEEMAALIDRRLDPLARAAIDSLSVALEEGSFTLAAQVRTELFSRDLLGPFAELLDQRHPMRMAGPARLVRRGALAWEVNEFVIYSFPFPQSAIPRLIDRLTGGSDGAFVIRVPETVGDVRIRGDGVTFYRRVE